MGFFFSTMGNDQPAAVYHPPQKPDPLTLTLNAGNDIVPITAMSFRVQGKTVEFTKISDVTQIHAQADERSDGRPGMIHYGLIFRNKFIVNGNDTYTYLLFHALYSNDKAKLEWVLTNNLGTANSTLAKVIGKTANDVLLTNWEKVSCKASMQVVVAAWKKVANNAFTMDAKVPIYVYSYCIFVLNFYHIQHIQAMALQKYDAKINCVLSAKYFYAVVMDKDVKSETEKWMNENRGYLLKMKNIDIHSVSEGIPCKGGEIFWKNRKEAITSDIYGVYRLQQRNSGQEVDKALQDVDDEKKCPETANVHDKEYRIVRKVLDNGYGYNWRDIYRDNEYKTIDDEFNKLTKDITVSLQTF